MPLAPIAGAHTLSVRYSVSGQQAVVVLGGAADLISAQGALDWLNHWQNAMRPLMSTTVTCLGATYRALAVSPSFALEVPAPTNPAGTAGTSVGLAAGSTVIKWQTAMGGRRGKGRTFVPGLPEGFINDDGRTFNSSGVTAATTAIAAYLAAGPASMPDQAVVSRKFLQVNSITSGSLLPIAGIQRRRMR